MDKETNLTSGARGYFEFMSKMGQTKHIGSMQATRELVDLCQIGDGAYVLDVGCGVGATASFLARTYDCRVMGVDLLETMIEQARGRIQEAGLDDRVEFKVADARELPFEPGTFDAVLVESVNVFFAEKQRAIEGYVRVTKPGGYVGLTEMTWLNPPSPEVAEYYRRVVYADSLQVEGWRQLLEEAGLEDIIAHAYKVDRAAEGRGQIEREGFRRIMRVMGRAVGLIFTDPQTRGFLKNVTSSLPKDMMGAMGYGVYAGRKPLG